MSLYPTHYSNALRRSSDQWSLNVGPFQSCVSAFLNPLVISPVPDA